MLRVNRGPPLRTAGTRRPFTLSLILSLRELIITHFLLLGAGFGRE